MATFIISVHYSTPQQQPPGRKFLPLNTCLLVGERLWACYFLLIAYLEKAFQFNILRDTVIIIFCIKLHDHFYTFSMAHSKSFHRFLVVKQSSLAYPYYVSYKIRKNNLWRWLPESEISIGDDDHHHHQRSSWWTKSQQRPIKVCLLIHRVNNNIKHNSPCSGVPLLIFSLLPSRRRDLAISYAPIHSPIISTCSQIETSLLPLFPGTNTHCLSHSVIQPGRNVSPIKSNRSKVQRSTCPKMSIVHKRMDIVLLL